MPLTLLDCAHWQQRVYSPDKSHWLILDQSESTTSPWAFGVVQLKDVDLLVLRGSVTSQDWFLDVQSQRGIVDGRLGTVPVGFDCGLDAFADRVKPISGSWIVVGHSLGAARACLFAALMAWEKNPPKALVLFGCPRPGQERLRELISTIPFVRSFVNRQDPVVQVPVDIPMIEPWMHPCELTPLDVAPAAGDHMILADHHIDLYTQGMAKMSETIWP